MNDLIPVNEFERLTGLVSAACDNAAIMVIDGDSYAAAANKAAEIKAVLKQVEETRKGITSQLDARKKQIMGFFQERFTAVLEPVCETLRGELFRYDEEQRRKRAEEQRRLEEQLKAKAKADAEAAALAAIKAGKEKLAEAVLENAKTEPVAVPVLAEAKPLPGCGISYRDVYKFEVTDPSQLPRMFLMPDEKAIRSFITAKKGAEQIPGVRIWSEKVQVQRS